MGWKIWKTLELFTACGLRILLVTTLQGTWKHNIHGQIILTVEEIELNLWPWDTFAELHHYPATPCTHIATFQTSTKIKGYLCPNQEDLHVCYSSEKIQLQNCVEWEYHQTKKTNNVCVNQEIKATQTRLWFLFLFQAEIIFLWESFLARRREREHTSSFRKSL